MKLTIAASALALVTLCSEASAQSKSLKDRLLGTWHFVIAEVTAPDGQKSFPFGPKPRGILIFTPEGDFAQIHIAGEVPKIASGNRLAATPEEYAGIMRGTIAQFGTYTVDEDKPDLHDEVHGQHVPELGGHAADALGRQADRRGVHQHQPASRRRPRLGVQFVPAREVGGHSPSLPGLTRQSISFARCVLRSGWTRGSSPRVTPANERAAQ